MEKASKPFLLDFNDRERARHAETLRALAKHAGEAATAIEAREDGTFVTRLMIIALTGLTVDKIGREVADMMGEQNKTDAEFPSVVGD